MAKQHDLATLLRPVYRKLNTQLDTALSRVETIKARIAEIERILGKKPL